MSENNEQGPSNENTTNRKRRSCSIALEKELRKMSSVSTLLDDALKNEPAAPDSGQNNDCVEIPVDDVLEHGNQGENIGGNPMRRQFKKRSAVYDPSNKPTLFAKFNKKFEPVFTACGRFTKKFEIWNPDLRVIEGRFGASIVSYFLFIRYLLFMNLIMLLIYFSWLVLPQVVSDRYNTEELEYNITAEYEILKNTTMRAHNHSAYTELGLKMAEEETDFEAFSFPNDTHRNKTVNISEHCHTMYTDALKNVSSTGISSMIQNFLQGTGYMENTVLFVGHYPSKSSAIAGWTYDVALAFLVVHLVAYILWMVLMLRYSSIGVKESQILNQKFKDYPRAIFIGWDYSIQSPQAAELGHKNFANELMSNLLEARLIEEEKSRSTNAWINLYMIRVAVNIAVAGIILLSYFTIYRVSHYVLKQQQSNQLQETGFRTLLIQFLSPMTNVIIQTVGYILFAELVKFEKYSIQTASNISVIRNVFLTLSTVFVLLLSVQVQIECEPRDICGVGKTEKCRTPICWESYVGKQFYKLAILSIFINIATFLFRDIPRYYLSKTKVFKFIGQQKFSLAFEILDPIYDQTILWLGVFFCPLLPLVTTINLVLFFYMKKASIMKFSEPALGAYKASRFNFTFMIMLLMSFLCSIIFYIKAFLSIHPSVGCSPYRNNSEIFETFYIYMRKWPTGIVKCVEFVFSGWFGVPIILCLCVCVYYYWSYGKFLTQLEQNLKDQLLMEGKDKQYLLEKIQGLGRQMQD